MRTYQKAVMAIVAVFLLSSCSANKGIFASKKAKDPVCGMRVVKANAFSYEYEDSKYYFDSDKCKQIFIMNPRKFAGQ